MSQALKVWHRRFLQGSGARPGIGKADQMVLLWRGSLKGTLGVHRLRSLWVHLNHDSSAMGPGARSSRGPDENRRVDYSHRGCTRDHQHSGDHEQRL
jgi:hypothetical protein